MPRSADAERLLVRFYDALREADVERLTSLFAAGGETLFVGTDPSEWFTGDVGIHDELTNAVASAGGLALVQSEPTAFADGSTAWLSDRPWFLLPDETEIPVRVTGVAVQRDGDWRFVQLHLSLGVNSQLPPEVVAITSRPVE